MPGTPSAPAAARGGVGGVEGGRGRGVLRAAEKGGGRGGRGTARDACSRFPYRRGTVVCAFMKICQTHPRDPFVPSSTPRPRETFVPSFPALLTSPSLPPAVLVPASVYRGPRVMIARLANEVL